MSDDERQRWAFVTDGHLILAVFWILFTLFLAWMVIDGGPGQGADPNDAGIDCGARPVLCE